MAALRASAKAKVEDGSECWFLFRARSEAAAGLDANIVGRALRPDPEALLRGRPASIELRFFARPPGENARSFPAATRQSVPAFFAPSSPVSMSRRTVDSAPGPAPEASQHKVTAGASSGALSARDAISRRRSRRAKTGRWTAPFSHVDKRRRA